MSFAAFEIVIIILLIIANGVFAMSETAFVSARKVRLQQRANEGDKKAHQIGSFLLFNLASHSSAFWQVHLVEQL